VIDANGSEDIFADKFEVRYPGAWVAGHQEGMFLHDVWGKAVDVKGLVRDSVRERDRGNLV
jgi:hypothetical protein